MNRHPRLARGVTITRRQISEEEIYYLVKDPRAGTFLRMGDVEAAVLRLLDGRRSAAEISRELDAAHDWDVPADVIEGFLSTLKGRGIVESQEFDPVEFGEEWLRQERARRRSLGTLLGSIAMFKMHLFNPRRFFGRIVGPLAFVWTPRFVLWSMLFMAAASILALYQSDEIVASMGEYVRSMGSSTTSLASRLAVVYLVFFIVVAVHETAHGLTCTHYGGTVTDMGFILFYLQIPGFYCDITDAYAFDKRSHRLWTTIAGGYSGLLLASAGVFLWWATDPGDMLNGAGLGLMFVGGPPLLIFNWNPLIRYDGYYILMDLLEAPNLMSNSFKYLGNLAQRKILRLDVRPLSVVPRLRRVYLVYSIATLVFLAPIVCSIPFIVYYLLSGMLGETIAALLAVIFAWKLFTSLAGKVSRPLGQSLRRHLNPLGPGAGAQAGRVRLAILAGGVLLLAVLAVAGPRFPVKAESWGVLEPWEMIEVHAARPGFVPADLDGVPMEGDAVRAGEPLLALENPEVEAAFREASHDLDGLRLRLIGLEARGDAAGAAERRAGVRALESRLAVLGAALDDLILEAPIDGVVLTPRLEQRGGSYLKPGDVWCVIGRTDRLRVRVRLSQKELGLIDAGSDALIRPRHLPDDLFEGRVRRLPAGRPPAPPPAVQASIPPAPAPPSTAASDVSVSGSLQVEVEVDNSSGLLRPGMSVRARIYGEKLTLMEHAVRGARRFFRGRLWW